MKIMVARGASVARLWAKVKPWAGNRNVDEERASALAARIREDKGEGESFAFSKSPITIGALDGGFLLIDGQHRRRAWELLGKPAAAEWLIHVIACETVEDVSKAFAAINTGAAVPEAFYNKDIGAVIEEFIEQLTAAYPLLVRAAKTCSPYICREQLMQVISSNEETKKGIRSGTITAKMLLEAMVGLDADARDLVARKLLAKSARHASAEKIGFFGALVKEWPMNFITTVLRGMPVEDD